MAVSRVHQQLEAIRQDESNERGAVTSEQLREVLEKNNLSMHDYRKTSQFNLGALSMDSKIGLSEDSHTMGEMLRSDEVESSTMGSWSINDVESTMDKNSVIELLNKGIEALPEKQKAILTATYFSPVMGVDGELRKTAAAARREAGMKKGEADRELAAAMRSLRETLMKAGYSEDELKR